MLWQIKPENDRRRPSEILENALTISSLQGLETFLPIFAISIPQGFGTFSGLLLLATLLSFLLTALNFCVQYPVSQIARRKYEALQASLRKRFNRLGSSWVYQHQLIWLLKRLTARTAVLCKRHLEQCKRAVLDSLSPIPFLLFRFKQAPLRFPSH